LGYFKSDDPMRISEPNNDEHAIVYLANKSIMKHPFMLLLMFPGIYVHFNFSTEKTHKNHSIQHLINSTQTDCSQVSLLCFFRSSV
jgi:hypothetical protein